MKLSQISIARAESAEMIELNSPQAQLRDRSLQRRSVFSPSHRAFAVIEMNNLPASILRTRTCKLPCKTSLIHKQEHRLPFGVSFSNQEHVRESQPWTYVMIELLRRASMMPGVLQSARTRFPRLARVLSWLPRQHAAGRITL